jgi:type IV secretory pathway component VirB8
LPGFHARRIFYESFAADLDRSFHTMLFIVIAAAAAAVVAATAIAAMVSYVATTSRQSSKFLSNKLAETSW